MGGLALDERTRLAIGLALGEPLDVEAARIGMCGAEIDAARRGRSFDVLTSHAVALALAGADQRPAERARAIRAGLREQVCSEIEAWADARREYRYPS